MGGRVGDRTRLWQKSGGEVGSSLPKRVVILLVEGCPATNTCIRCVPRTGGPGTCWVLRLLAYCGMLAKYSPSSSGSAPCCGSLQFWANQWSLSGLAPALVQHSISAGVYGVLWLSLNPHQIVGGSALSVSDSPFILAGRKITPYWYDVQQ